MFKAMQRFKCLIFVFILILVYSSSMADVHATPLKQDELDIKWLKKEYLDVDNFYEDYSVVEGEGTFNDGDRIQGIIDLSGKEVIPPHFIIPNGFSNGVLELGLYPSEVDYVLVDSSFKILEKVKGDLTNSYVYKIPLFRFINPFLDEYTSATVGERDERVFINKNGQFLGAIDSKWKKIYAVTAFSEGVAFARKKIGEPKEYHKILEKIPNAILLEDNAFLESGVYGAVEVIDKNGSTISKPNKQYNRYTTFQQGVAFAALKNEMDPDDSYLWGAIDKNGKEVIPCEYSDVFANTRKMKAFDKFGYVKMVKGVENQLIHKTGKRVFEQYDDFKQDRFHDGLCAVKKNEKWGFIDKDGKEVIPCKYEDAFPFSEGLAGVKINGKIAMIDISGNLITEPIFDDVKLFYKGVAPVKIENKWGLLKYPDQKDKNIQKNKNSVSEAIYSKVKLSVKGNVIEDLEVYNIEGNNYFKLRDIALLLNNTAKKFSIRWNNDQKRISILKGEDYQKVGGELQEGDQKNKIARASDSKLEINQKEKNAKAYNIGGNNYYKLRDLSEILEFEVDWDAKTNTIMMEIE